MLLLVHVFDLIVFGGVALTKSLSPSRWNQGREAVPPVNELHHLFGAKTSALVHSEQTNDTYMEREQHQRTQTLGHGQQHELIQCHRRRSERATT